VNIYTLCKPSSAPTFQGGYISFRFNTEWKAQFICETAGIGMKKEERAKQITSPSNDKILHLAKKLPAKGVGGRAGGRRREDEEEDKFPYSKTLSTWIERRTPPAALGNQ
jgi:hypothetical protein